MMIIIDQEIFNVYNVLWSIEAVIFLFRYFIFFLIFFKKHFKINSTLELASKNIWSTNVIFLNSML